MTIQPYLNTGNLKNVDANTYAFPIVIKVQHLKDRRYEPTGFNSTIKHWDSEKQRVRKSHPQCELINQKITQMLGVGAQYEKYAEANDLPINVKDVFNTETIEERKYFTKYLEKLSKTREGQGKFNEANHFRTLAKQLREVSQKTEVAFRDLNNDLITALFIYFKNELENSTSTMILKRSYLNVAYDQAYFTDKITKEVNPFTKAAIPDGKESKTKEWLTPEEVALVEAVKTRGANQRRVKDMFLWSFYCKGIRLQNVMGLTKDSVREDIVYWVPLKQGSQNVNKVTGTEELHPKLREIWERYKDTPGKYLFLTPEEGKKYESKENDYFAKNFCGRTNSRLRSILKRAGISKHITFHCSRHSFAKLALNTVGDLTVIKELLYHEDIKSTQVYTGQLGDAKINRITKSIYYAQTA